MDEQSLRDRLQDGAAIIEHAIVPRAFTPATYQDAVDAMREAAAALASPPLNTERTERLREIVWDALWGNHDADESTACTWSEALDAEAEMDDMVSVCIDTVRRIETLLFSQAND